MKLTPEQQADIARQKAANPGARHFRFQATTEQAAEWRAAAEAAESHKEQIAEDYRKLVKAAEEEGFSGWLRRAIGRAGRPIRKIAADANIDFRLLHEFRMGDATLPSDAIDRIIAALGLALAEEPAR
jgi:hypothetical protein